MKRFTAILIALFLAIAGFAQTSGKENNDCIKRNNYSFTARLKNYPLIYLPEFRSCHSKKMRQAIRIVFPGKTICRRTEESSPGISIGQHCDQKMDMLKDFFAKAGIVCGTNNHPTSVLHRAAGRLNTSSIKITIRK